MTRRPGILYPAAGAVALLLLAAGQWLLDARRVVAAPTRGAAWIWAADTVLEDRPEVFYALRDVELEFEPVAAEIEILADEEYWLSVNGASVGAGRWTPGTPLDRYDVRHWLRRGRNRLLVELRSARGAGGLIARLVASGNDAELVVGSDDTWRIVRRHQNSLVSPDEVAPEGRSPRVWGPAPLGRWGMPTVGPLLPRLDQLRRSRRPWVPRQVRIGPEGVWLPAPGRATTALGPWVVFDWGAEVAGYLSIGFRPEDEPAHALLWMGSESPASPLGVDPRLDPHDVVLLGAPGRTWWTDVRPRRFRYLHVLGLDRVTVAEVYPVHADRAGALLAAPSKPVGLWGLEAPRLVTAVEHEVWRELEGLPGLGGG